MEGKISGFIISIIIVSVVVLGFSIFYSGISTNYGVTNNQNISKYNKLNEINNVTNDLINETTNPASSQLGGFAILGDYLAKGYNTLKLTFVSFSYFNAMANYAITGTPWGDDGTGSAIPLIITAIASIVLILIVFAIIEVLTGRGGL